jgi:hypothetical protein
MQSKDSAIIVIPFFLIVKSHKTKAKTGIYINNNFGKLFVNDSVNFSTICSFVSLTVNHFFRNQYSVSLTCTFYLHVSEWSLIRWWICIQNQQLLFSERISSLACLFFSILSVCCSIFFIVSLFCCDSNPTLLIHPRSFLLYAKNLWWVWYLLFVFCNSGCNFFSD